MCFADRGNKKRVVFGKKNRRTKCAADRRVKGGSPCGGLGGQGPKQCVKKGSGYAFKSFLRNCRYKGTHSIGF